MEENLKIINQIFLQAIKLDVSNKHNIHAEYYSSSKRLKIDIEYNGNGLFYDGLNRGWSVSVGNLDLLKQVLEELNRLDLPEESIDDDFLE